MRGWLLAAFQDLKTITNEVEVYTWDHIKSSPGNKVFFIRED